MKKFQKLITILALSILLLIIVGGVLFISRTKTNNSFEFVPKNATNVIFIKPEVIASDFYQLLKRDPTLLDSTSNAKVDIKAIQSNMGGNGLNPLVDAVLYSFYDAQNNSYLGIICNVINEDQFIKSLTKSPELIQRNVIEEGEIIQLEKENLIIIKKEHDAIILQNIEKEKQTNKEVAQQQYELIFSKNNQTLVQNNNDFSNFSKQKNHLGIWSSKGKNVYDKYFNLFEITKSFEDKTISLTSKEENIDIQSIINLKNKEIITPIQNSNISLNEFELAKFSLSTSPKYLKDIFEKTLKKQQHYLLDYCTGTFCSSITGYRETPVFTTSIKQSINPETFATIDIIDTIEASPVLNIPEMMHTFKVNNSSELFNALNEDTLISNEAGYWTIPHPFFVKENLYITLKGNLLYIGTNKEFEAITPQFTTLSFITDIPKSISTYPPKDAFQRIGMAAIPEIKISTLEINFDRIDGDKLYLNGVMNTTDSTQHSMLTLAGEALKLRGLLKGFI